MKISEITTVITGGTPSTKNKAFWENGSIPWLQSGVCKNGYVDTCSKYITKAGLDNSSAKMMPAGTVIIALTGATVGKVGLMRINACANQSVTGIIPCESFLPLYMFYYLMSIRGKIIHDSYGDAQPHISQQYVKDIDIPLPSLPEQEQIVARIEELFSQLDAGVETLKKTKAQLAVYRQAVLKEAFEGRLSAEWRKEHSDCSPDRDYESIAIKAPMYKDTSGDENEIHLTLPDNWIKLRMGDIFSVEVGATPSRRVSEYWNGAINWVSSGEVRFNRIFSTDERITEAGLANSSTNVQPVGTIMLAMIGEGKTRGQAAILEIPAAHNQNTAAILVSATPCDPKYIYYFLQMNYENTRRVGSGNNQKALNKERVRALRFPFTSFEEQHVIVEAIESRLSVCDSIEQTVDAALQQAEAMRQGILKDAFEGRL